jgi:hypothetical protein
MGIGATSTMIHDFFITPADGKLSALFLLAIKQRMQLCKNLSFHKAM